MKRLYTLLGLLFMVALLPLSAQKTQSDASIYGHVLSVETGEHLSYINISLKGTTLGVMTDETGHFMINHVPEGSYTIVASALGYTSVEKSLVIKKNSHNQIDFELAEASFAVDEVVVSASRNETKKLTSPTIVNVLSSKLFEATSSSNLAETMNFQSGLRVENTCGNCGATQLRINGLEGQYSQVLLDSRAIFSSLAAVYGLEQLPVSMIERVEVVRGGGSALFGSNAIGGVVNIITKEPLRNSFTVSNNTQMYEKGGLETNTSLNGSFVTDDYKAGMYIFGMVKDKDAYDRNEDGFSDLPTLKSETLGFRGYYKTSLYSKLTAEYHHITEYRRGGDHLDQPAHEANIAEQVSHRIDGGGLNFDYYSPNQLHKLGVYTSAQQVLRDSYYGVDKDINAYGNTTDITYVAGAQYGFSWKLGLPSDLTAGLEYTYNDLHDLMPGYDRDFKQQTAVYGAFLQNEWKSDKLNFVLGGRLDQHNMMESAVFSPRANVRYSPIKEVGIRLSYSSGYRAPQAFDEDLHIEAVSGAPSLIQLAEGLRPEYSHSVSGSVDLYRNFGNVQTNLLIEGFYTDLDDVFTLEKIGIDDENRLILERRNAAGATVKGLTAELKVGIPNSFEVQAGYTLQRSEYDEPEQWSDQLEAQTSMFRSPNQYGYLSATYYVNKKLTASLFGNYTGSMLVQHNNGYIDADREVETPNFWDMGLKVAYKIPISKSVDLEINGGVKNILDQFQEDMDSTMDRDAGYIYGPSLPRTYFVGLKMLL